MCVSEGMDIGRTAAAVIMCLSGATASLTEDDQEKNPARLTFRMGVAAGCRVADRPRPPRPRVRARPRPVLDVNLLCRVNAQS